MVKRFETFKTDDKPVALSVLISCRADPGNCSNHYVSLGPGEYRSGTSIRVTLFLVHRDTVGSQWETLKLSSETQFDPVQASPCWETTSKNFGTVHMSSRRVVLTPPSTLFWGTNSTHLPFRQYSSSSNPNKSNQNPHPYLDPHPFVYLCSKLSIV